MSTGDDGSVPPFERYLAGLITSWEALAVPHPDATVVRGEGFIAARFPNPVLNNAAILAADAIRAAEAIYDGTNHYALWTRDPADADVMARRGYRPSETTRPMLCHLEDIEEMAGPAVLIDADPARVAELNGAPADLVLGVPGLRAYSTKDYRSGLVTISVGRDVNISFVATAPDARRQGHSTAVVRAALKDSRSRGFEMAGLQSTPMAEGLYLRLGFRSVGRWQEWTRPQ